MRISPILIAFGAAPAAAAANAQESNQTPAAVASVMACRSETNAEARLRCFDAATSRLAEAVQTGAVVAIDREGVRKTRRSLFGFDIDLPFFGGRDKDEVPEAKEIEATVKSSREVPYQKWLLEFDTGAVWQTTESSAISMPKAGEKVTVREGVAGGYMLHHRKRTVRAKRVR